MAAANIEFEKIIGTLESDTTVRSAKVPGMCSLLNTGDEVVYISISPTIAADGLQHDGEMFLPVNVPIPLPRSMRQFFHKTAAASAKVLVVTDVS